MDPYFWQIPVLILVGAVAGVLNVLAGGGSLLTLPLLIFFGLPAATANGTNRVAIFCQNIFAIAGFKRQGIFPIRLALLCIPPALIGSYIGANLAITVDEMVFRRLLALVMVGVLVFMVVDPLKHVQQAEKPMTPPRLALLVVSFFGIGIYGGFVQAGVGFMTLESNIVDQPPTTGCWWDPWWGYMCTTTWSTFKTTRFAYNMGLGVRWDINNAMYIRGSYNKEWISLDNGSMSFDILSFEGGLMF